MSNQPNALRLAHELEREKWRVSAVTLQNAADELNRLHSINAELLEALKSMVREFGYCVTHPNGLVHAEHEAIRSAIAAIRRATEEA